MSTPKEQQEGETRECTVQIGNDEHFMLLSANVNVKPFQIEISETPLALTWRDIRSSPPTGWIELYRPAAELGVCQRIVLARWSEEANGFVWPDRTFDPFGAPAEAEEAIEAGDCYVCDSFTHWRPVVFPEGEQR